MDPPLHSRVKSAISWVDSSMWKLSKATKDANISRQGFGFCVLEYARYFVHPEEKSALSPTQCTVSQVRCNNGKTTWIALWIASALTLFSRSGSPAITGCLQTSKECSRKRDLAPMKKRYWKLRCILRPKTNCSTKKALNCYRNVGISVLP